MATEFDDGQLEAITGGDTEFEREVLVEYLNSAPADVAKLKAAVSAGNAPAASAAAHSIKGASATIGAKGFAAIALELERAGKKGDLTGSPEVLARLEAEYLELVEVLKLRIAKAA
jgi:HPt (histidine-containing phosphotransfer) domain-containing protein